MGGKHETIRHLAKSVVSCILLSVCGFGSQAWEEKKGELGTLSGSGNKSGSVTSAVRWASTVTLLSAVYYLQFQIWTRLWQRRRHENLRMLRRGQYRRTNTSASGSIDSTSRSSESTNTRDEFGMEDVDLNSLPSLNENEVWVEGGVVVSNNVYYPELTMTSVWVYVYGWGILLFVCVYCLSGANIPSSCWWVMGMIALSFDELVSKGVDKWFICILGLSLCGSIFSVWSGALMDDKGNFIGDLMFTNKSSLPLLDFVMGVVLPVSTPFIFFSIRTTVRSVTRDVYKLCEFALPFMTVLAVFFLVATSGVCDAIDHVSTVGDRNVKYATGSAINFDGSETIGMHSGIRTLRRTGYSISSHDHNASRAPMVESVSKFEEGYVKNLNENHSLARLYMNSSVPQYILLFLSPFVAFWLINVLIITIHMGYSTEFITAFILVTSVRYGIAHEIGIWSSLALSCAGFAFILLLFVRRN